MMPGMTVAEFGSCLGAALALAAAGFALGAGRVIGASSSSSGASSIESACERSNPPTPWRLIPESLGRARLIPEADGWAAVTSESLGPASGVASNSSLASRRGQLEVAAALGLERRGDVARRHQLEVAARLALQSSRRTPRPRSRGGRPAMAGSSVGFSASIHAARGRR